MRQLKKAYTILEYVKIKIRKGNIVMKFKIYQLKKEHDDAMFLSLDMLKHFNLEFDFSKYKEVYEGNMNANGLGDLFAIFNIDRPADFKGHSLSVSDVIQIIESDKVEAGYYFCDSFGWKEVEV